MMGPTLQLTAHTVHTVHYTMSTELRTLLVQEFTLIFSFTTQRQMAASSITASSTFSTSTAADGRNKAVYGFPLAALPGNPPVFTGFPLARYPHEFFHRPNQHHRIEQLRREQRQKASLFRFTAAALCFFFTMGCLLFTIWLFLRPRLPQVQLASVSVSPLSTSTTNVSAACNVSLLLTNPNGKLTIFYDHLELFVGYQPHKVPLFQVQVPPFAQPRKNDTLLHIHMEILNATVGNDVVKALKGNLVRGSVGFGVKVIALIRLESKDWKTRSHLITVDCNDVVVEFSSANGQGTMLNPYEDCRVAL